MTKSDYFSPKRDVTCRWCHAPVRINRRGSPAEYCSPAHRNAYWTAARRFTASLVDAGIITIEVVKRGPAGVHALVIDKTSRAIEETTHDQERE